jgi:LysR family transcriptional regulator, glycine cleavage system transcriptional activator
MRYLVKASPIVSAALRPCERITAREDSKEKRVFLDKSISFCLYSGVPSLNSSLSVLRGFDAAARLGSFAKASAALSLTESAISHQVRSLESELGQPLFRRVGRSVVLTDAGKDFGKTVNRILRSLDEGVMRLSPYLKPRSVVLYTNSAFARGFLLPRLEQLRKAHPAVDLWVDTSERTVDFEVDEVDILICADERPATRYAQVKPLLADRRTPMASPGLIARQGGVPANPAHLAGWPLLHDEGVLSWRDWFDKVQSGVDLDAGPAFSDHALALEAAALGHGVVLGSVIAADHYLRSRSLISLCERSLPGKSYEIYCDTRTIDDESVRICYDWLLAAAETLWVA